MKKVTHEQMNAMNWRYKKQTPPKDEHPLNGEVKVTKLPHPFKCSKCDYVGENKSDVNQHWLDH